MIAHIPFHNMAAKELSCLLEKPGRTTKVCCSVVHNTEVLEASCSQAKLELTKCRKSFHNTAEEEPNCLPARPGRMMKVCCSFLHSKEVEVVRC